MVENSLMLFKHEKFGNIRAVEIEGEPWFVGRDVAVALEYERPADAVRAHVDPEDRGVCKMPTPSGAQEMVIINEPGYYSLVFSSKMKAAKEFKRWVASEVLPAIRKNGSYTMPMASKGLMLEAGERFDAIEARLRAMEQSVIGVGQIARSNQKTLGYIGYGMRRDRTAGKVTRWQMKAKKKFKAIAEYLGIEDRAVLKSLYDMMEDEFDFDMNDYLDEYKYVNNLEKCSGFTVVCTYKELRQRFDIVIDGMLERLGLEVDTTLPRRKTIFDEYLAAQEEIKAIEGSV